MSNDPSANDPHSVLPAAAPSATDSTVDAVTPCDSWKTNPPTVQPATPAASVRPASASPAVHVRGYEILSELGRGGMGVVYKARQIRPPRLVALKMILAGGHASEGDLARFKVEAEAVARLQHPGIVQIFEVGEHDGLPFFSLEFIEGGSLDKRLNGVPLPPTTAADLSVLLARAMQAAHEKGILHRDLKPANVFLMPTNDATGVLLGDSFGKTTHYLPKIGDFGLAKSLSDNSELGMRNAESKPDDALRTPTLPTPLTVAGAIVGTPSYMAPEQAFGQGDKSTAAVDVYSLGAILYELLTGRPPFCAASTLETLRQVIHDEPVPPARLNPVTPRDLQTICLTCLQKEPARRYASALALAEDLRRFLADEPLLAKREGPARRWIRKLRRHRYSAAGAIVIVILSLIAWFIVARAIRERDTFASQRKHAEIDRESLSLLNQIDNELNDAAWRPEQVDGQLALAEELARLNTERADEARQRIEQRMEAFIDGYLHKSGQLSSDEIAALDDCLKRLEKFDPERAEPLRRDRKQRAGEWQTVLDLHAPFAQRDQIECAHAEFTVEGDKLLVSTKRKSGLAYVNSRATCQGQLDFEATFDDTWDKARELGLIVNADPSQSSIYALAHAPDRPAIALAHDTGLVEMMNTQSGESLWQERASQSAVTCLAYSSDGKTLLSGGTDGKVQQWNPTTGQLLNTFTHSTDPVTSLAIAPDGQTVAAGYVKEIKVWSLTERKDYPALTSERSDGLPAAIFSDRINVTFSDDSSTLFASWFVFVAGWDVKSGKQTWINSNHSNAIFRMVGAKDRTSFYTLAAPNLDTFARAGAMAHALKQNTATLTHLAGLSAKSLAISPDGHFVALGSQDGVINIWDVDASQIRAALNVREASVDAITYVPDGQALIIADSAGGLFGLNIATRTIRVYRSSGDYFLRLTTLDPKQTLEQARTAGERVELQLVRDGVVQRFLQLDVPPGPLRLRMYRLNEVVTAQVNNSPPLVYHDFLPFRPEGGQFALLWPVQARLTRLIAKTHEVPSEASTLEKGEVEFDRGNWTAALAFYDDHVRAAGRTDPAAALAVQSKSAMCLARCNRIQEAMLQFRKVYESADSGTSIWPAQSGLELWRLLVQMGEDEEARQLLEDMMRRFTLRSEARLMQVLSEPMTMRIEKFFWRTTTSPENWLMFDPGFEKQVQAFADFRRAVLQSEGEIPRLPAEATLCVWAYHLAGQESSAQDAAQEFLKNIGPGISIHLWLPYYDVPNSLEEFCWMARTYGDALQALERLELKPFKAPGVLREDLDQWTRSVFLVELCRIYAQKKDWDKAEAALDAVFAKFDFAKVRPNQDYRNSDLIAWQTASLLKGFLCERRGDLEAARQAWQQGTRQQFLKNLAPELKTGAPEDRFGIGFDRILRVFSGDPTATDEERHPLYLGPLDFGNLFRDRSPHKAIVDLIPEEGALQNRIWRTAEGRKFAWQWALREMSWPERQRGLLILECVEGLRVGAFPKGTNAEQSELLHSLVREVWAAYSRREIALAQVLQFAKAWNGTTGFLGWKSLSDSLKDQPALRARIAYVLGERYLAVRNQPKVAAEMLRLAQADAAPESTLKRLATDAIERTKGN